MCIKEEEYVKVLFIG